MPTFDWDLTSTEYIQGVQTTDPDTGFRRQIYPTVEELAAKYGCALTTIKYKASSDNWLKQRKIFQAKIRDYNQERRLSTYLSESSKIDALTLLHIESIYKVLDFKIKQDYGLITDPDEGIYSIDPEDVAPVNVQELKTMVSLLKEAHTLVRNVVGEPVQSDTLLKEINAYATENLSHANEVEKRKQKIKKIELSTLDREKRIKELEEKLKSDAENKL